MQHKFMRSSTMSRSKIVLCLILVIILFIVASNSAKEKGKGNEKKAKEKLTSIDKAKGEKLIGGKKYCLCDQSDEVTSSGNNEEGTSTISDRAVDENGLNLVTQEYDNGIEEGEKGDVNKTGNQGVDMGEETNGFNGTVELSSGDNMDSGSNETQNGASKMEDSIGQVDLPSPKMKGKGKQKQKISKQEKKPVEKRKPKEKVAKQKIEPKGKKVVDKKKDNKKPKPVNPNVLKWKGKTVIVAGTSATDQPEKVIGAPKEHQKQNAFGKSCKVAKKKTSKTIHTTTVEPIATTENTENATVNMGPAAENVDNNLFQPCQVERKRGGTPKPKVQKTQKIQKEQKSAKARRKRSESFAAVNWLWKDPENIPVVFDSSFPEENRPVARAAMIMWQNYTCVNFVEQANPPGGNAPYILLTTGGGTCTTDRLGPNFYPPYTTTIDATMCMNNTGSLAHEFGHTIGLQHSQKRVDRDSYLNIFSENMADAWKPQFEKDSTQFYTDWGVPFYYDSIMHYFPYAATVNTLMTLCPLDPLMEVLMGQREEPAFGDLSLINRMYCQESCFNRSDMLKPFTGELSMTISGRTCQSWISQTPHAHNFASVGNHSYCRNPDGWTGGPWCYTNEVTIVLEPCFSACEDLAAVGRPFCEGWCYNGGYHDPNNCACVCPRYATGTYCETINYSKKYGHLSCGGKIHLLENHFYGISSPNWPQNYTTDEVCMWWLQAPVGMKVKITFSDFLIELADESGCYDYLEVRKSLCASATTQPTDMRFCGDSLSRDEETGHRQIVSDDNNLVLKFISDDNDVSRGFSLVATAVLP